MMSGEESMSLGSDIEFERGTLVSFGVVPTWSLRLLGRGGGGTVGSANGCGIGRGSEGG